MPGFSRSSSSTTFVLIGTGALLVLIVILITGGFTVSIGPIRVSSHDPGTPLVVAAAAWLAVLLLAGRDSAGALASVGTHLDRHAGATVAVMACATAAVGLSLGSHTAGGADSSGYVSQSALFAAGQLTRDEPLARNVGWPDATWALSPYGYRPGASRGESVPTYPPGLPLVMAGARLVGGEAAVYFVVPLFGSLAVWCTYALGLRLHSRAAGVVASLLLATSPIFLFQLLQPMSDVPVTAWWALALVLALGDRPSLALASGAAAGFALLTRPNLVPLAAAVAIVAARHPWTSPARGASQWLRLAAFSSGCIVAPITIAVLHTRWYGSPLASGYGSPGELFRLASVWPNVVGYASRVVRGDAPALVLAACSAAVLLLSGARAASTEVRRRIRGPLLLALLTGTATLACYLPYFAFAEWPYLRFLLPAYPAALVLAACLLNEAAAAHAGRAAVLVVLFAAAAAAAFNINHARREQAFNLHRYEARYRLAGRYLAATLPPNAVVIALQESGSARYYTGRPVVRWDMLRDLDGAVRDLTARGLLPVLLVEDAEVSDLRSRFPQSALARLDWPPRAEVGSDTRARIFVPSDRAAPGRVITDRFR